MIPPINILRLSFSSRIKTPAKTEVRVITPEKEVLRFKPITERLYCWPE